MRITGEGYDALISALGKIPQDIRLIHLSNDQVETAAYRVIPFLFDDEKSPCVVQCIHPEWHARYDEIVGAQN